MKVSQLIPQPPNKRPFRENQHIHIPLQSGCYVLSNLDETIIYIGLSKCLVHRFNQHLDNNEKTGLTPLGRAIWFHWLLWENLEQLERTWLNIHEIAEGKLPCLNTNRSPLPM